MGDLIVMPRSNAPGRHREIPIDGAAILFFTGVRYYRQSEESVPAPVQKRRRSARKTAETRRLEVTA